MQGKKDYEEKLFLSFRLSERVPTDNFYRKLRETLDLSFLRKMTQCYYGTEGQKSIDAEVFFKLMLIGYLENINSDRKIVEQASMRMDMLFFLGYDIDEPLPWHSTLSRTRNLLGKAVFLEMFRHILKICISKGMVSGTRQAVDSAFIKANAAMDSLVEKASEDFYNEVRENEENKSGKIQRNREQKHSDRFVSTSDPDARVSQKKGKVSQLNYYGQISVDTGNHVICGAMADFADQKDSECTAAIVGQTIENLKGNAIIVEEVLADTNYSSGKSLRYLEEQNIKSYIPNHGGYNPEKDGFTYNKENDCYVCSQGVKLHFRGIYRKANRIVTARSYRTQIGDCKTCPLHETCTNKRGYKEISVTSDKPYYERAAKRMNTLKGKRMMRLRGATVEPVLGTLLHFRAMKKVYTKGIDLADKHVLLAAMAYNLKKLVAYKDIKSATNTIRNTIANFKMTALNDLLHFYKLIFDYVTKKYHPEILMCL
ncbi:MAG: transposase [Paludibacter sp.]|jgi:transposase|nr:transposase [Paludibacter sp.]